MKWRRCAVEDEQAILRLSREPMAGRINLVWGLTRLCCPKGCNSLKAYAVVSDNEITGCALGWDWPDGNRYLNGLRFSRSMNTRPTPAFWRKGFDSLMEGTDHAWTSVGIENHRARQILESGVRCIPCYRPRQKITTWFTPLSPNRANDDSAPELNKQLGIEAADWRQVLIPSGQGLAYRFGRLFNRLGCPGIPPPRQKIHLGYYTPSQNATVRDMRRIFRQIRGYDGLIISLPSDSREARITERALPRITWKWHSLLYSVSWDRNLSLPEIPRWKGIWM